MKKNKHSHGETLPGADASILAELAQSRFLPLDKNLAKLYLDKLSCECTKQMGQAIFDCDESNVQAKAFMDWADSL